MKLLYNTIKTTIYDSPKYAQHTKIYNIWSNDIYELTLHPPSLHYQIIHDTYI